MLGANKSLILKKEIIIIKKNVDRNLSMETEQRIELNIREELRIRE
jgi:hypothetical protein